MTDQPSERNNEPNRPRNPNTLQGLLRFAVETTRSEDAPFASNFGEMEQARRAFLEEALQSMTVNVVEQLEAATRILTNPSATEEDKLEALNCLLDYVDNIDNANDFCKIGGLQVVLTLLATDYPLVAVQSEAASLIAELAQNNPFCQKQLHELDALPKLIPLLSNEHTSANAIRAISSLARNYEPLAAAFIDMGGLECLLVCIQSNPPKLAIHSLFLLRSFCAEYPAVRDELVKLNAIEHIVEQLQPIGEFDVRVEATLSLLNNLCEIQEACFRCRNSAISLQSKLIRLIELSAGKKECQEIAEDSQSLLSKLFLVSAHDAKADR